MSSLFANLGGTSTTSSINQSGQTASLFGNTAASQPQQTSNIFGNLGGAQSQQSSSLFGAAGSQTKPPTSGGLFPNLSSTTQAPGTSGGSTSLFSNTQQAGSTAQQGTSFFAPQNTTNASKAPGASFLSGQPQALNGSQAQPGLGQSQDAVSKTSQPAFFDSLLEKGRKRTRAGDNPGLSQIPSLQLGLGDIGRKAKELGTSPQAPIKRIDSKVHYLLAASGVDLGSTKKDLRAFQASTLTASEVQQGTSQWDPDTDKAVNRIHQRMSEKMMAEATERSRRDFDRFLEENVDLNMDRQRRKIMEHFGLMSQSSSGHDGTGDFPGGGASRSFGRSMRRKGLEGVEGGGTLKRSTFGRSSLQKSVIGAPSKSPGKATLFANAGDTPGSSLATGTTFSTEKQTRYAEKTHNLNQSRLQEVSYPLLHEYLGVEKQYGGEGKLLDAFYAIKEIIGESAQGTSSAHAGTGEQSFGSDYLDEAPNSQKTMQIRKTIIHGSRNFLEKQFLQQLEGTIAQNPREANIGGVPSMTNKVRGYVRIRVARKDLAPDGVELQRIGDDCCWALLFFFLRTGLIKEAIEYIKNNSSALRNMDRTLVACIDAFSKSPDRRLPRSAQDRINAEYQQRTRIAPENSVDPYRLACYKIVGRCELSKRVIDTISQSTEDWIWLQFNLAREVNRVEESAGEVFGLREVRETIQEIGQRFFSKSSEGSGGNYATYFCLLVLGGMFEQAISFLYPYDYLSAVHFAIALNYYGLLRVSDFSAADTELLTYNTKEQPQISFGRMIGYYTRDFRVGDAEAAVDYLALICINARLPGELGKSQAALCHEALRELVLETREFALLLGDIHSNGSKIKGAIEQRLPILHIQDDEELVRTITLQAARMADDNGRITDAVLLYHLADDYDNVIIIINRAVSEAISVDIGQAQLTLQPLKPRTQDQSTQPSQQQQQQQQQGTSLSLTSVDDPITLAHNMISLYNSNALYYQRIRPINRDACAILLQMAQARSLVAAGKWKEALDVIVDLQLLPLHAHGSTAMIRSSATAFNALPSPVSRNLGPLLLWTIQCVGNQREVLVEGGGYSVPGSDRGTREQMVEEMATMAKDLMIFAGLVKYRLGERVWEAVVRGGEGV